MSLRAAQSIIAGQGRWAIATVAHFIIGWPQPHLTFPKPGTQAGLFVYLPSPFRQQQIPQSGGKACAKRW